MLHIDLIYLSERPQMAGEDIHILMTVERGHLFQKPSIHISKWSSPDQVPLFSFFFGWSEKKGSNAHQTTMLIRVQK